MHQHAVYRAHTQPMNSLTRWKMATKGKRKGVKRVYVGCREVVFGNTGWLDIPPWLLVGPHHNDKGVVVVQARRWALVRLFMDRQGGRQVVVMVVMVVLVIVLVVVDNVSCGGDIGDNEAVSSY